MVRVSSYLLRSPVIKFRKGSGGASTAAAPPASSPSPGGASAFQAQSQPAATMSTAINDTELPARYRRQPLSEEEIAYINGGGIAQYESRDDQTRSPARALGVLRIPKGILIQSGMNKKEAVTLNITLQKANMRK